MITSKLELALTSALQSPESFIACSDEVLDVFTSLMHRCRVDEAWLIAERFTRLFREAPELFRGEPWNSRLAACLCRMEAAGAYFTAHLGQHERALRCSRKALELLRLRERNAGTDDDWAGWLQVRCYIAASLGYAKWADPQLRDEVMTPQQLQAEWHHCLGSYARCGDEAQRQQLRGHLMMAFNDVMRALLLHGRIGPDDYNKLALEARKVLLIDIPHYPLPAPETLSFSNFQHYYYYSICFMLESCSALPQRERLQAYMDMNYRSSRALSLANPETDMSEYLRRSCAMEFQLATSRLALKALTRRRIHRSSSAG